MRQRVGTMDGDRYEGTEMLTRVLFLLIALAGLAVLAVLLARGLDARQAAETGPRWRRQLACAGLFLLGCLGCSSGEPNLPPKVDSPVVAGQALEETPQWKNVASVWAEAEAVASGQRGDYPFDEKGKKALLASLERATATVGKLETGGALSAPEAGLLTSGLQSLARAVGAKRPTEMRDATCYKPMMFIPAKDSLERLSARLPLLQKLAKEKAIHRAALERVLPPIEADLKMLTSPEQVKRLDAGRQAEVEKVRREAQAALGEIRKLLEAQK